jgi:predicted transcriptional regulator
MRPRVDWMTQADERILEFLHEKDIVASPGVIATNLDYNNKYISERCSKLVDAGLIQRVDASNYRLTEKGEQFLEGELESEDVSLEESK